jgi:hypothetical protein
VRRARDRTRHRRGVERGNAAAPLTGSRGHAAEIRKRNKEFLSRVCGVVI